MPRIHVLRLTDEQTPELALPQELAGHTFKVHQVPIHQVERQEAARADVVVMDTEDADAVMQGLERMRCMPCLVLKDDVRAEDRLRLREHGAHDCLSRAEPAALGQAVLMALAAWRSDQALARAIGGLEQEKRHLEDQVRVLSHDVRDPLAGLTGVLQLLAGSIEERLSEDEEALLHLALNAARSLADYVQDVAGYASLHPEQARPEDVDLGEVLDDVEGLLGSLIQTSEARITRGDLPVVHADRSRLATVMKNLITNAIKHRTEAAPRIHIVARRRGPEWVISVRDNGQGIPRDDLKRIFRLFERGGRQEGHGMGLAICQRAVEQLGGRIWVRSAPDRGSTFLFSVPIGSTETRAAPQEARLRPLAAR